MLETVAMVCSFQHLNIDVIPLGTGHQLQGGGGYKTGGGGTRSFTPTKRGGGKSFSHSEGGGTKSSGVDSMR